MADAAITLRINEAQLADIRRLLADYPRAIPKVIMRALNRAGAKMESLTVKHIARELKIPAKLARGRTHRVKAGARSMLTSVTAEGSRVDVMAFKPRQNQQGVTLNIPGKGRTLITHAFILQGVSHFPDGVWRRMKRSDVSAKTARKLGVDQEESTSEYVSRLPIRRVQVNETPASVVRPEVDRIMAEGEVVFRKRLDAETELILARKRSA